MQYPQTLLSPTSPTKTQPPRPLPLDFNHPPRLLPFQSDSHSPLKSHPHTHGFHGLQSIYSPSPHSILEATLSPKNSQSQRLALHSIPNQAPEYMFANVPKSPARVKFNPSIDIASIQGTQQGSQLPKILAQELSPRARNIASINMDNDKSGVNNEYTGPRSPGNVAVNDFTAALVKSKTKTIQGFDYGKLGIAKVEKYDDGEASPRVGDKKPFYLPQMVVKDKKSQQQLLGKSSFERSVTLLETKEDDYIVPVESNLHGMPSISPYQRRACPVSMTTVIKNPIHNGHAMGAEKYYLKNSLGGTGRYNMESRVEDESLVQQKTMTWQPGYEGLGDSNNGEALEKKVRKAMTFIGQKQGDKSTLQENSTSVKIKNFGRVQNMQNMQKSQQEELEMNYETASKEKLGPIVRVARPDKKVFPQKVVRVKQEDKDNSEDEGVRAMEFKVRSPIMKKNLKEVFRSGTSTDVGEEVSTPRSAREKVQENKQENGGMYKMKIKIMGEDGIKNKEIKMFAGDLSEILEKNFNENEDSEMNEDSTTARNTKKSSNGVNLANLLADLDAQDNLSPSQSQSPRAVRVKLTKKK